MTDQANPTEYSTATPASPSSTEQPNEPEMSSAPESGTSLTASPSPVVRLAAMAFEGGKEAEGDLGTPTGIGAVYALAAALGEVVAAISSEDDEAEENFRRALSVSLHRRNAVMAAKRTAL